MKRAAISLAGLIYGLLLMWLCLYTFSRIGWHPSNETANGCHEIGPCEMPWWVFPTLLLYILVPPSLFAALNAIAWRRWRVRNWGLCFAILTLLSVALSLSGYML
jgi:hypothetical protein